LSETKIYAIWAYMFPWNFLDTRHSIVYVLSFMVIMLCPICWCPAF